jgi:hypothetical protein
MLSPLFEKLTFDLIVKKFPSFYGIRSCITMFRTIAPQLMILHLNPIHLAIPTLYNIVTSTSDFTEISLLFKSFDKNSVWTSSLPCVCYWESCWIIWTNAFSCLFDNQNTLRNIRCSHTTKEMTTIVGESYLCFNMICQTNQTQQRCETSWTQRLWDTKVDNSCLFTSLSMCVRRILKLCHACKMNISCISQKERISVSH